MTTAMDMTPNEIRLLREAFDDQDARLVAGEVFVPESLRNVADHLVEVGLLTGPDVRLDLPLVYRITAAGRRALWALDDA
jgi:IMP dehydrogenase/GMP reductase